MPLPSAISRIRDERPADAAAIAAITTAAFADALHRDGNEAAIVARLREDGALAISLVAEAAGRIEGHVALSPVTIDGGRMRWFGLGPISVAPERQRAGIGSALIREGLRRLRARGAAGCVVLGDPAYYARFGFVPADPLTYAGAPAACFMRLDFEPGAAAAGDVRYPPAFGD